MRLHSALAFGLFSSALATPINSAKMDLPSVQATFDNIQQGIDKMISHVKIFKGEKDVLDAIIADSNGILAAIAEGTEKVAKSPAMGITDALNILAPVQILASKVEEVVLVLASKKETIGKAQADAAILGELQKQKTGADGLVKVILANLPMPGLIGPIAGPIAKSITDKLENGIRLWS